MTIKEKSTGQQGLSFFKVSCKISYIIGIIEKVNNYFAPPITCDICQCYYKLKCLLNFAVYSVNCSEWWGAVDSLGQCWLTILSAVSN
jgi:hypothetical protein